MPTLQYALSLSGNGGNINRSVPRSADGGASREIALPAGKAGTLSTRTDSNTGIVTVASGHGILDTDTIDLHWPTGKVRYGMDVTGVTATTVSVDLGAGDALPAQDAAVVVTKRVQVNADIDGSALAILGIEVGYADPASTAYAHAEFQDAGSFTVAALLLGANAPQIYDVVASPGLNVFSGSVVSKVFVSNGSGTADATLKILWVADSTP